MYLVACCAKLEVCYIVYLVVHLSYILVLVFHTSDIAYLNVDDIAYFKAIMYNSHGCGETWICGETQSSDQHYIFD